MNTLLAERLARAPVPWDFESWGVPRGHYVYAVVIRGRRRYIGKGCRDRAQHHGEAARRENDKRQTAKRLRDQKPLRRVLCQAQQLGIDNFTEILLSNLSHEQALAAERAAIQELGCRTGRIGGALLNVYHAGEALPEHRVRWRFRDPVDVLAESPEAKARALRSAAARDRFQSRKMKRDEGGRFLEAVIP